MNKLSISDWLLGLAVAALVCGPLLMAPTSNCPADFADSEGQCAIYQKEWGRIIAGTHFTDWVLAFAALGQLGVLCVQAAIYSRQRDLMEGQLKVTETAANAALAALDRPWLAVEVFSHNAANWEFGGVPLIVDFQIRNHGKAPAFLNSIKTVLFLCWESAASAPYGGNIETIIEVAELPQPDEIDSFIERHASAPFRDMNEHRRAEAQKAGVSINSLFEPVRFDSLITLPSEQATEVLFATINPLHVGPNNNIPIEALARAYLIGRVTYDGPTIGHEHLTFCWRANRYGRMEPVGRAPYNDRKKSQK